jgi:hypothetical protein
MNSRFSLTVIGDASWSVSFAERHSAALILSIQKASKKLEEARLTQVNQKKVSLQLYLQLLSQPYYCNNIEVINQSKENWKTYEIVTGGRYSNSGNPGEGRLAIFAFLYLVVVSRISLKKKKKQKISAEDQTRSNTNISLSLVTGARRLFLALTEYALGQILLSTWNKSAWRKKKLTEKVHLVERLPQRVSQTQASLWALLSEIWT